MFRLLPGRRLHSNLARGRTAWTTSWAAPARRHGQASAHGQFCRPKTPKWIGQYQRLVGYKFAIGDIRASDRRIWRRSRRPRWPLPLLLAYRLRPSAIWLGLGLCPPRRINMHIWRDAWFLTRRWLSADQPPHPRDVRSPWLPRYLPAQGDTGPPSYRLKANDKRAAGPFKRILLQPFVRHDEASPVPPIARQVNGTFTQNWIILSRSARFAHST